MSSPANFGLLDALVVVGPTMMFLIQNMSPLLQSYVDLDKFNDRVSVPNLEFGEQFDFIIVGGGSSGSALASRLSENYRVLLLEAGGYPSPLISLPAWSYLMNNQPAYDFQYRTTPQKHASFGLNHNVSYWGSGKGLGGSSLINAAIYIRGNIQGFDQLAERVDDSRWNLENMLRNYKSIETYNGLFDDFSHGKEGDVSIEKGYVAPMVDNLMRAGVEMGYKVRDPNNYGPITEGFAPIDFYMKFGRRNDAYTSFLLPILNRKSLTIRKFSFVRKILMNGTTAFGVEYERHGETLQAVATKEVILCTGAIETPKLLMLAGIGPRDHLDELDIPVIVDLPVGKILEDKYGALVGPFLVDNGKSVIPERDITTSSLMQWFLRGTGVVATGRTEATHHVTTNFAKSENRMDVPDVHTYVLVTSPGEVLNIALRDAINYKPESLRYVNAARGHDTFFQLVTLSRPFGHGSLRLVDKNPHSHPIIDPNYLADPRDVRTLVDGIKFSVQLIEETTSFKDINAKLLDIPFPGCEDFIFKSNSYYECLARHSTVSAFKYGATTRLGKDESDPKAVVDSQFRVLGTKGLRVVGAPVLEVSVVSVNDITCRMMGVFAAELIKEYWEGI